METKEAYQEKVEAQLQQLQSQIDELKVKASLAKLEAKDKYNEELSDLNAKCETTRLKLQELKTKSDSAWEEMKAGLEKAWDELQNSFNRAVARFQ